MHRRLLTISFFLLLIALFPMTQCRAEPADEWFARGHALYQAGQYQQAIAAFDEAIMLNPDHADAYAERGVSHTNMRNPQRAIADFNEFIRLRPDNPRGYAFRAKAYLDMFKLQEALADFSRAIELNPNFSLAYHDRGAVYKQLKQYSEALADFTRAIDLKDIDIFMAYTNRGSCYTILGQYDKALADFATALGHNPNHEPAFIKRAAVYMLTNQPALAVADLTKAIGLNPQRPASFYLRAEAYLKTNQSSLALTDANEVLRLVPSIYSAYWLQSQAYDQLGQQENSLRALARFMNYAPLNDPRRAKAKELLQHVQIKEIDPKVPIDRTPSLPPDATAADGSVITGQERQAIRTSVQLMTAYNSKDLTRIRQIDVRTRTMPDSHVTAVIGNTKDWALYAVEVIAYKEGVITARVITSHEILDSGRVGTTINHICLIYRIASVEGMWRVIQVSEELGTDLFDTFKIAEKAAKRFGVGNLAKLEL